MTTDPPWACAACGADLADAAVTNVQKRQVFEAAPPPPPTVTDWAYYRAVRPLPTLWIRDSAGRWHATRDYAPRPLGGNGEITLELAIAPLLEAGTPWIDVVAAGQSAQVRARLPVRWTWNP